MGWRDFQVSANMEYMESMELINTPPPLIPLIPLIPTGAAPENAALITADNYFSEIEPDLLKVFPLPSAVEITRAGIVYASPPRCYACRSTDLWRSRYGVTNCRRCHPPMKGAEA